MQNKYGQCKGKDIFLYRTVEKVAIILYGPIKGAIFDKVIFEKKKEMTQKHVLWGKSKAFLNFLFSYK